MLRINIENKRASPISSRFYFYVNHMKILFIGGNGNISWNCTVQALKKGYEVWALNRDSGSVMRRELPKEVHKLKADIGNPSSVRDVIKGLKFDVIANFICFTPEQAKRDLELYSGLCEQFIFISTASAYQKRADSACL